MCSVKKMKINHVAACSKWPLRMYLRLQRETNYGFEAEEKLQILLKREREELVGVCETLSEFELRCLHALLFWFRPKLICSYLLIVVWFAYAKSEHWEVKKKRTDFCDLKLHDVTYNNLTCRLSCVAGTRSLMLYAACNRSIMFVFSWCPWLRPVVYGVSSMLNDLHFNMTALLALEAFHHLHLTHFLGCTLYLC